MIIAGGVWTGFTPATGLLVTLISSTAQQQLATDTNGAYAFTNVAVGDYQITLPLDVRASYAPGVQLLTVTVTSSTVTNLDFHSLRPALRASTAGTNAANLQVNLAGAGVPSTSYQIQYSTNLTQYSTTLTNWDLLGSVTADTAGYFQFTDNPANVPLRYYRAFSPY